MSALCQNINEVAHKRQRATKSFIIFCPQKSKFNLDAYLTSHIPRQKDSALNETNLLKKHMFHYSVH
jgi:hypothetical protein